MHATKVDNNNNNIDDNKKIDVNVDNDS